MSTETRRINSILDLMPNYPAKPGSGLNASVGLIALDDCAVVPLNSESDLVIGSDFVRGEGFHLFKKGVLSWQDVGYYLIGANASDLAAMGLRLSELLWCLDTPLKCQMMITKVLWRHPNGLRRF